MVDAYSPSRVPFDAYTLSVLAFVIEKTTNNSVPIITFAACDRSDNFVFSSTEKLMNSTRNYDPGTGSITEEVYSSLAEIKAKRSHLAQAFTMCLLLINWALTLGSTYVMLVVVVQREKMPEGVLLLPVTIVLTIPTLRSLYVGSPPFGIYIGGSKVLESWSKD